MGNSFYNIEHKIGDSVFMITNDSEISLEVREDKNCVNKIEIDSEGIHYYDSDDNELMDSGIVEFWTREEAEKVLDDLNQTYLNKIQDNPVFYCIKKGHVVETEIEEIMCEKGTKNTDVYILVKNRSQKERIWYSLGKNCNFKIHGKYCPRAYLTQEEAEKALSQKKDKSEFDKSDK